MYAADKSPSPLQKPPNTTPTFTKVHSTTPEPKAPGTKAFKYKSSQQKFMALKPLLDWTQKFPVQKTFSSWSPMLFLTEVRSSGKSFNEHGTTTHVYNQRRDLRVQSSNCWGRNGNLIFLITSFTPIIAIRECCAVMCSVASACLYVWLSVCNSNCGKSSSEIYFYLPNLQFKVVYKDYRVKVKVTKAKKIVSMSAVWAQYFECFDPERLFLVLGRPMLSYHWTYVVLSVLFLFYFILFYFSSRYVIRWSILFCKRNSLWTMNCELYQNIWASSYIKDRVIKVSCTGVRKRVCVSRSPLVYFRLKYNHVLSFICF